MADAQAIEFGRAEAMRLGCQVMAERTCDALAERLGKRWRPDDRDAMVSAITDSLVEAFAPPSASRGEQEAEQWVQPGHVRMNVSPEARDALQALLCSPAYHGTGVGYSEFILRAVEAASASRGAEGEETEESGHA